MKEEQHRFLSLVGHMPARLTVEQVGWVLNCQAHDVPILVSSKLLRPLGNPAPNSVKYFAAAEVVELARDRAWLSKLTSTVNRYWQLKNRRKTESALPHGETEAVAAELEGVFKRA